MTEGALFHPPALKPGRFGTAAIYLAFAAVIVRTLADESNRPYLTRYLALELTFVLLFTLALWRYNMPTRLAHVYLSLQCAIVFGILSIHPDFDFVVLLYALLSYQVAYFFSGRVSWVWVGILVAFTGGSLVYYLGALRGLALSLTTIAAEIILPALIRASYEVDTQRARSQALLTQLQAAHQQLQAYTAQADELAAVQERNRLARELHDTVSQQIFSISLSARSAQLLLERDPPRAAQQLRSLYEMITEALSQLRSLITQLRPANK